MNSLKALWARIRASLDKFEALAAKDLGDLWQNYRGFLIAFGAIVLTVKFRDILIDLIVSSSKKMFQSAENKNNSLQLKEDKDNNQANALVKEAQALPSQEQPVDVDWYKK